MADPPSMTDALIGQWKRGALDLDQLESAATAAWWAWDALNEIAPERAATFLRPERGQGRDATVNLIRDIRIYHEVKLFVRLKLDAGRKTSLRKAYEAVAEGHPMLTWRGIKAIHLKERKRESS